MEKGLQERQQYLGAQGRFAASSCAIHNDSHDDTSWMDPRLIHVGTLWEGFLQATDEKGNALKLFSIELIRPCWRGAPLLGTPNEHLGHMRRTA